MSSPHIPYQLDVNKTWTGFMLYTQEVLDYRAKGQLYVGVISAHSNKNFVMNVPPKKENRIPTKQVAQGR